MGFLSAFLDDEPPKPPEPSVPVEALFGRTSHAYESPFVETSGAGRAVEESHDLNRVLELPSRERPDTATLKGLIEEYTARLGRGEVSCRCQEIVPRACAKRLQPVQAWALHEIEKYGGLLGPISVGHGKTLLDLLAPMVLPGCQKAVLLVQPNLRDQLLQIEWDFYGQHWKLPNLSGGRWFVQGRPVLHVVSFSELSGAKATDLLEKIRPDLVVVDEAHNLRRREAARTKRFLRHFSHHPKTRLCAWSGTLTSKSIKDYAHLANLALKNGSPTPLHWPTVEEWAGAIDPTQEFPNPIGALRRLCLPGEHVWAGWQRRLKATPGVVASLDEENCNASILFSERKIAPPQQVQDLIADIHAKWQRPDGDELKQAIDVWRCATQMACGFYYRWRWPKNATDDLIERWLDARKHWHKELRDKLQHSRPHLDSELLCKLAAIRFYEGYRGPLPVWPALAWPAWKEVSEEFERKTGWTKPATDTVWVDDFMVQDAVKWADENKKGIIWYDHKGLGQAIAKASKLTWYGAESETPGANINLPREKGDRVVIASIDAHQAGKNLQVFERNLITYPPSDGKTWEQLIGRTHRQGQLADEVRFDVYRHTADMIDALDKARRLAAYIEGTMTQQKLLRATYLF